MSDEASTAQRSYSRAFENLVAEPNDVVGLLAYALYKQHVREEFSQGIHTEGRLRNPTQTTIDMFRSSAESRLNQFAADAIDEARDEIQQSAILNTLESSVSEISQHISRSTGSVRAIWTNFIAWLLTIAVTVLLLLFFAVTGAQQLMIEPITKAIERNTSPDRTLQD